MSILADYDSITSMKGFRNMTHLTNCGCTQLVFGNAGDRGRKFGECPAALRQELEKAVQAVEDMVKYTPNQTQEDDKDGSNS